MKSDSKQRRRLRRLTDEEIDLYNSVSDRAACIANIKLKQHKQTGGEPECNAVVRRDAKFNGGRQISLAKYHSYVWNFWFHRSLDELRKGIIRF